MTRRIETLTLEQWDARYDALRAGPLREPAYGGPLRRHVREGGDLRLAQLRFDPSAAGLRLWNFLLTEEDRLRAARAEGHLLVGAMKDLGTVPVLAFALPRTVAFYPDGAWWIPCIMQRSDRLLHRADAMGVDESFCPVRAMLGAFESAAHFPLPDVLLCSVGAACDDFSAIAQRLAAMGHPITWWEIPHRRPPEPGEESVDLPGSAPLRTKGNAASREAGGDAGDARDENESTPIPCIPCIPALSEGCEDASPKPPDCVGGIPAPTTDAVWDLPLRAPRALVDFVAGELQRVRDVLAAAAGCELTDDMLRCGIAHANRVRRTLAELRDLAFSAPVAPLPALELHIAEMLALHFCSDRSECLRVLEDLLAEARRRVRAGEGVLDPAAVRTFWVNPVADLRMMNVLEECGGRVCGTEYLFTHALDEIPEHLPPLEALARTALADPMAGPARDRAARVVRDARRWSAQAAVVSRIPGASHCATEGAVIADALRRELGIPVVELETPPLIDPMLPGLRTRIQALLEAARDRRTP